jgi:hypothetical protein
MAALLGVASPCSAQDTGGTQPPDSPPTTTALNIPPPPRADPAPAPPAAQTDTADSRGFHWGDFYFKPGGRVKLDVIRDFDPVGSEDSFDTRTIVVDGTRGTNSNIHAKETRLNLEITGRVEERDLRLFVETDFYGTSTTLRLRHAYGTWGNLLAGQTWTTFMDDDNLPRTIDFESPTAFAQIRQALVRWTQEAGILTWSAAVEDNKSSIVVPTLVPGKAEYPLPDLVGRLRFDFGGGHVTTSGFLGAARFRPTDNTIDTDTVRLWGTMLSAKFPTFGRDTVYGVVTVGEGIGRYRGGTTAVPDETGALHAIGGAAFMGGYEHFWSERWSTNAVGSIGDTYDQDFYPDTINKRLTYGAVNLLYWFLGDRAWTGVEYLVGYRKTFDEGENSASAHRLQYAVRFNLP